MKKIILVNIAVFLAFLFLTEFIFLCHKFYLKYRKIKRVYHYGTVQTTKKAVKSIIDLYTINENYFDEQTFRPPLLTQKTNDGIILAGCSFTYGETLGEDETLGYKLFKATDKNIYNLGIQGGSPRETLYIFNHSDILNKYTQNNKDIILVLYTYIDDHLRRLYTDTRTRDPKYNLSADNKLVYVKPKIHSEAYINIVSDNLQYLVPIEKQHNLLNQYMLEINKKIKENYNNAKFVILVFEEKKEPNRWEILEKDGILVLNVKEITGHDFSSEEYLSSDYYHPNEKVWDELTPGLVNVLEQKHILQ